MRYDFYMALHNGHPPLPPCVGPWGADYKAAGDLQQLTRIANVNSGRWRLLLLYVDYGAAARLG